MESTEPEKKEGFEPSEEQKGFLERMFNLDETIVDPEYNSTHICLSEVEAGKRAELVSDIEYTYSLALNKGDYYLG